jgi:hypothetical protein
MAESSKKNVLFSQTQSKHSWKNVMRLFAAILACLLGLTLPTLAQDSTTDLFSTRHTNAVPPPFPLVEGPKDSTIVQFVARLLQHQHYLQMPINDDVSSKFLDRYLDSLDNFHIYFLQSDLQEFEKYRYRLDDLTVGDGDTTVSRLVFNRFRDRLNQQYEYVQQLLKENKFDFTGNDRYTVDRKKMPRPRDMAEAKKLWRDRLRHEYLIEKLNKVDPAEIVTNLTRRYTRVLRLINEYDNDVTPCKLTSPPSPASTIPTPTTWANPNSTTSAST